jgi:hypothetical protein
MDAERFDALSRALTTPGSRRTTLRALLGSLLSGVLLGASPDTLAGPRKRNGKHPSTTRGRAKTGHVKISKKDRLQESKQDRPKESQEVRQKPQEQQLTNEPARDVAAEAVAAERQAVTSDEVTATRHGCRHAGSSCTSPGQCCSGRCAANGTCQKCTRASQCPAPPANEPCKKRVCTSTGKCVIRNKKDDVACPDGTCCSGICCATSHWCDPRSGTGICTLKQANGTACRPVTDDDETSEQCASGYCVTGFCCNNACPFINANSKTCAGGTCILTCNAGWGNCDNDTSNGCETDLQWNADHCGGCDSPCEGSCGGTGHFECQGDECLCVQ